MEEDYGYVPIAEAAEILNLSKEAIRKRIKRGTLKAVKGKHGEWQVFIDRTGVEDGGKDAGEDASSAVISVLNARIADLQDHIDRQERRIERQDHILMALAQKIPQLEASSSQAEKEDAENTLNEHLEIGSEDPDYANDSFPFDKIPFTTGKKRELRPWWKFWMNKGAAD